MKIPTFRDVELLSAYLDGQLSQADAVRLEARLKADPDLRAVMDDLSQSRTLLRKLPQRRAPRNFTLTPKMAGVKAPLPRAVPALRWATSFAAFLLFLSMAANALAPSLSSRPMAYGMGGGGDASDQAPMMMAAPATEAPAATEAPLMEAAATEPPAATEAPALAPVATEEYLIPVTGGGAEEALPTQTAPAPDSSMKALSTEAAPAQPSELPAPEPLRAPIPLTWQIGLLVVALSTGGLAWILAELANQSWRKKLK
jgi:predicted anti-sigma-YlaC factor YlaD